MRRRTSRARMSRWEIMEFWSLGGGFILDGEGDEESGNAILKL